MGDTFRNGRRRIVDNNFVSLLLPFQMDAADVPNYRNYVYGRRRKRENLHTRIAMEYLYRGGFVFLQRITTWARNVI